MRLRIIIIFAIAMALIAIVSLSMANRASAPLPVGVIFTGQEPGPPYRAAGFDITNRDFVSVMLWEVEVQVQSNGVWNTISKQHAVISPCIQPGKTNVDFQPVIEPGDSKRIVVEWPEDKPWRIEIACAREAKGFSGLLEKSWIALKTHRKPDLTNRSWIATGSVQSDEVRR
jgi:hypothetical protein